MSDTNTPVTIITATSPLIDVNGLSTFWDKAKEYVNAAKQDAIDAAGQALVDANDYTDQQIEAAVEDVNTSINTTLGDYYTSAVVDSKLADYTNTTVMEGAIADAKEAAVSEANSYTSQAVAEAIAGGIKFKGVVPSLPESPNNGDLIIVETDFTVGDKKYTAGSEYVYVKPGEAAGKWVELGNADINSKLIASLETKHNDFEKAYAQDKSAQSTKDGEQDNLLSNHTNRLVVLEGITIATATQIEGIFTQQN